MIRIGIGGGGYIILYITVYSTIIIIRTAPKI